MPRSAFANYGAQRSRFSCPSVTTFSSSRPTLHLSETPGPTSSTAPQFADFLTVASLATSGPQITPVSKKIEKEKKKHNPYLESESENILTLTLSQAPTFVCFYICTQRPQSLFFFFCFFFLPFQCVPMSGFHSWYATAEAHTHTHTHHLWWRLEPARHKRATSPPRLEPNKD